MMQILDEIKDKVNIELPKITIIFSKLEHLIEKEKQIFISALKSSLNFSEKHLS